MLSIENPLNSSLKRKHTTETDESQKMHKKVRIQLPEGPEISPEAPLFSYEMYKSWVQKALDDMDKGNAEQVNTLTSQIPVRSSTSSEIFSFVQMEYVLSVLSSEISRLDNVACAPLITAILRLRWSNVENQAFVSAYVKFLAVLVSGIPKWWTEVASKVIQEFELADTGRHHSIIKHILKIIPTSSSVLGNYFHKFFPHKSDTTRNYCNYVKNLLHVTEYAEELEFSVWSVIIEKLVQLDVELFDDNDEDDDDDEDYEQEEDDEDDDDDQDEDNEEDNDIPVNFVPEEDEEYEPDNLAQNAILIRKKLDSTLSMLFIFLDKKLNHETLEHGTGLRLFSSLLTLFKTFVLPTHRTSAVQYIIFRCCNTRADLMEAFLVSMLEIAMAPSESIELRQKALQYVSSFIARAKNLTRTQIVFVISILASWVNRYIDEREIEVDHAIGGMSRFKMFYAACQALFYIFCFRHKMLRRDDEDNGWECDLDQLYQRMIVTKFNPLKYCKSTVVGMFAGIAQRENAVYCFTVIEQNRLGRFNRAGSPGLSGATSAPGIGSNFFSKKREFVQIEAYFPFDPLSLKNSRKLLGDIFVEWDDVAESFDTSSEEYEEGNTEDDDNEDDDDDDDDDEDEEDDQVQENI